MNIVQIEKAQKIDSNWDDLVESVYQKKEFLYHLEKNNFCNQTYYHALHNNVLVAGAVVYSLKVNVLTFVKFKVKIPMRIIGIPVSVDAKGLIGQQGYFKKLIEHILSNEKGLVLCLNYNESINIDSLIEMQTLPTMILQSYNNSWGAYLKRLRHQYRRRILKAECKFKGVSTEKSFCSRFTEAHYQLYLNIMKRTKTQLETLPFNFFYHLPQDYMLISNFAGEQLISWHITTHDQGIYYFMFGGLQYELRDKYDTYLNNLIQIIKEGTALNSNYINLGQTAEVPKNRLGAQMVKKKMFLYHRSFVVRSLFQIFRNILGYNLKTPPAHVFKKNALA